LTSADFRVFTEPGGAALSRLRGLFYFYKEHSCGEFILFDG